MHESTCQDGFAYKDRARWQASCGADLLPATLDSDCAALGQNPDCGLGVIRRLLSGRTTGRPAAFLPRQWRNGLSSRVGSAVGGGSKCRSDHSPVQCHCSLAHGGFVPHHVFAGAPGFRSRAYLDARAGTRPILQWSCDATPETGPPASRSCQPRTSIISTRIRRAAHRRDGSLRDDQSHRP